MGHDWTTRNTSARSIPRVTAQGRGSGNREREKDRDAGPLLLPTVHSRGAVLTDLLRDLRNKKFPEPSWCKRASRDSKLLLKFMWRYEGPRLHTTTWKMKNEVGRHIKKHSSQYSVVLS